MATFKEIRGQTIKKYTTDPTNSLIGQMWYNSTTGTLKGLVVSEAWSSGAPTLNAARGRFGTGTQTAALLFGGRTAPTTNITAAEEYNGAGWATGGVLTTARRTLGGAGTQTASLAIGGFTTIQVTTVEEYDGSSWTASPALAVKKGQNGAFGTATAAVTEGGAPAPAAFETWNNVSWTAGPGPIGPANRFGSAGSGTATAGLFSGGHPASPTDNMDTTNEYNGTAFSTGGTLNTGRGYMGAFGIQTATLGGGGYSTTTLNVTEEYDGATWTTSPATLGTAAYNGGAAGTTTAGILAGAGPAYPSNTEEWNKSSTVFTPATWAAGGTLNTTRSQLAGAGAKSAGLVFGGTPPTSSSPAATNGQKTESYDGTTWTNENNKTQYTRQQSGFGIQTAAVSFAGYGPPSGYKNDTEEYNGSTWTGGGAYPTVLSNGSGGSTGILTAGLNAAGYGGSGYVNITGEYDGSTWTTGNTVPVTAQNTNQFGTQTAAVTVGGWTGSAITTTAEYNGTSWTGANALPVGAAQNGRVGTQTDGMIYGGLLGSPYSTSSMVYDGTNWSSNPSLSTGRTAAGPSTSAGATTGAFYAGGDLSETTIYNITEEYSAATTAENIKTVTTS